MKTKKFVVAVAAMCAMFATEVNAQTSSPKSEPAVLTAEEIATVGNLLSTPAEQIGISKKDSLYFRALLANGNKPILRRVTVAGELGGKMFEAGDTVSIFIIRTAGGFNVHYDGNRTVEKKKTVVVGGYEPNKRVAGEPALNGQVVERKRNSVTERDGDKEVTYNKTSLDKVSDEYLEAVKAGEAKMFDNVSNDGEGRKISKLYLELNGGGNFAFNGSEIHPQFGIVLGWETKSMLFAVRGNLSWSSYNQTAGEDEVSEDHQVLKNAEVSGRYPKYEAKAELGYKMWQSVRYTDYVAAYVAAGLGGCRTDGDAAQASSTLIGFCFEAGLEGKLSISDHFALTANVGGNLINKNFHDSKQDANFGIFASVGGRVSF